jgi:hypothetical protein
MLLLRKWRKSTWISYCWVLLLHVNVELLQHKTFN